MPWTTTSVTSVPSGRASALGDRTRRAPASQPRRSKRESRRAIAGAERVTERSVRRAGDDPAPRARSAGATIAAWNS